MRRPGLILLSLLALSGLVSAAGPKIEKAGVESAGQKRVYYLFAPETAKEHPAPLILMLHGSGRDGRILVERWQKLAEKEGIILVGPNATNPQAWTGQNDSPAFLRDVIEDVKAKYSVDPKRVYLFGHSAGAQFAIIMASLESTYFAAAAVHAGALRPEEFIAFSYATRKIPIALWSGTNDNLVPINMVKATAAELKRLEFPMELTVMPNHDHDYYSVSDAVNRGAWQFLCDKRIEKPEFTEYAAPK